MKKILLLSLLVPFIGTAQFFTEDFEGAVGLNGLPASWTETGLSSDGIYAVGNTGSASSGYLTYPDHTNFAFTNDDACDCDKSADRLILPAQDFSGYSIVQMQFSYYLNGGYSETAEVQVSTDGGGNWISLTSLTPNATAFTDGQIVDLSSYAGTGFTNVLVSFLYNDGGNWAFSLAIDDVELHDTDLLSNESFKSQEFSFYPNPTSNELFINTDITVKGIKVVNMLGQEVLAIDNNSFNGSINVSDLEKGTYFLQIESESKTTVKKFIKN